MSGFLGQILGGLTGSAGGAAPGISSVVTQILGGGGAGGGLSTLIAQLDQAGLGDKVRSWVGTGANQPVSPDQLAQALPSDQVQGWSQQTGLDPSSLLAALSHVLPQAVDQATPAGTVPEGGTPAPGLDVEGLVGRLFSGQTKIG